MDPEVRGRSRVPMVVAALAASILIMAGSIQAGVAIPGATEDLMVDGTGAVADGVADAPVELPADPTTRGGPRMDEVASELSGIVEAILGQGDDTIPHITLNASLPAADGEGDPQKEDREIHVETHWMYRPLLEWHGQAVQPECWGNNGKFRPKPARDPDAAAILVEQTIINGLHLTPGGSFQPLSPWRLHFTDARMGPDGGLVVEGALVWTGEGDAPRV